MTDANYKFTPKDIFEAIRATVGVPKDKKISVTLDVPLRNLGEKHELIIDDNKNLTLIISE